MATKASSRVLTDHEEIRRWAEERDAKPSAVRRTHGDDNTGIIRLDFPGYSGENSLEEISWEEWFDDFDDRNLALIVQDETANGQTSNFNKLVSRDSVEQGSEERSSRGRGRNSSAQASSGRKSSAQSKSGSSSRSRSSSPGSTSSKKSSDGESVSHKRKSTGTKGRSSKKKAA